MKTTFKIKLKTVVTLLISVMTSLPTLAYDKKDEQAITAKVNQIKQGMQTKDAKMILDTMPQKFFGVLANRANTSEGQARQTLENLTAKLLKSDPYKKDYMIDYSKARASHSDTGREYAVFPSTCRLENDSQTITNKGNLIAVEDDESWYLMRIDSDAHVAMFREMYPDIKSIELFEKSFDVQEK